jgi:hypothetical protein
MIVSLGRKMKRKTNSDQKGHALQPSWTFLAGFILVGKVLQRT